MKKRRCSLCGGKLVNNRCTECGLDNTKNDEQYKNMINKGECDGEALTHVHHKETKPNVDRRPVERTTAGQSTGREKPPVYQRPTQRNISANTRRKQKSPFRMFKFGYLLFFLVILGLIMWSKFQEFDYEGLLGELSEEGAVYDEQDPYQYVTRELSEDGDVYEVMLEPGLYQVGVHIPEGKYLVEAEEKEYGYINVQDEENCIYYFIDFGDYEGVSWRNDDVRLYEGAILEVPLRMKVRLYSENAQVESMEKIENPLTEEVVLGGNAVSGVDFEPGMYDISYKAPDDKNDAFTDVTCTPAIREGQYQEIATALAFDAYEGDAVYHNVLLNSGTTVVIDGTAEIRLVPSQFPGQ